MDSKNNVLETNAACLKRKTDKYKIGNNPSAAKDGAKNGPFARPKPKPKGVTFSEAYKEHNSKEQAKQNFQDQRIQQGKQTVDVMRDIGKSISLFSYTDDDYLAECMEFIESDEFGSKGRKEDVIEVVEKHPSRFIKIFRVIVKRPDDYDARKKTMRIMDTFHRILRTVD